MARKSWPAACCLKEVGTRAMPNNQAFPARILVVDDDPLILRLIIDTLAVEGYDVDGAEHGVAALEKIRRAPFDLILSDLHMPQLDGVGLYRALTDEHGHLVPKIIFLTGSVGSSELHRFLKETGLPLLRKPFNLAELQQIVRQALASP
jgi:CheY-like chemotaxis protein